MRQLGNAVPVKLAQVIGKSVYDALASLDDCCSDEKLLDEQLSR